MTQNNQNYLGKEGQSWRNYISLYCANQAGVGLAKERHTDWYSETESPKVNAHIDGQVILTKMLRKLNAGNKSFQQMVLGQLDIHMQKNVRI
jgi:hypothetical protein